MAVGSELPKIGSVMVQCAERAMGRHEPPRVAMSHHEPPWAAMRHVLCRYLELLLLYDMDVSCHRPFLSGTSLEPAVIPTAQASSFTLQYFPYYV